MASERIVEPTSTGSAAGAKTGSEAIVVGIGASAGALEALRTLFGGARMDIGAAFIVMVHRPPHEGSRLVELLQPYTGRLRLRKAPVLVADIVRDAVATVRPLIDRSGHELVVALPSEPIVLEGDAARLTQVLANLLSNSARYTPGNGRIELNVARDAESVVFTVRDNGYGIAEATLPHVFEMFFQGSDPRAAPQAGLGIGLALAKSLIEMHGGTIEVVSTRLDRGTAFAVRLPANVQRVKPDTVFLDLKMPEMDGYEVARRMRDEPWASDAWLVALTGWGLDDHKRRSTEAGFDQHLPKPADPAALEGILARGNGTRVH